MQFQKILSYDVYGQNPAKRFDYICSLLDQTIDPTSLEPSLINANDKAVYISPRARALSCLNQDTALSITILQSLNEVPFALKSVCTAADFERQGSTAVRQAFLDLFIADRLDLSHKQLKAELDYLLTLSKDNPDALAISHTFRLRLLQTYLKTNRELFNEPKLILEYLDPNVHWADFGSFVSLPE
jgi:hypothetical protein